MFDVGFWELCLIGVISLIVIGPERLPKIARLTGFWIGKTRNMVASVKQEISEELRAEELRQTLQEQVDVEEIRQLVDDTNQAVNLPRQQRKEKAKIKHKSDNK